MNLKARIRRAEQMAASFRQPEPPTAGQLDYDRLLEMLLMAEEGATGIVPPPPRRIVPDGLTAREACEFLMRRD
jgi:hypothetical protein